MPTRLDRFHVFSNGNVVSNRYASNFEAEGIRLAQNARVYGSATTGGVSLSKQLAINTRNGMVVAEARQKISARQIAKGIGAVAGGPLGLTLLAVPVMLDLLDDANVRMQDGQLQKISPEICTSNCFTYRGVAGSTPVTAGTLSAYCSAYASTANSVSPWPRWVLLAVDEPGQRCQYRRTFQNNSTDTTYATPTRTSRAPDPDAWVNATPAEFENALTNANPSPEVLRAMAERGITPDPDPADPAQITNPQPSQEKTTTRTNPDGSTETTVCRTTGTVVGNNLRLTESCTVTSRDPQGNITGTTTTTTDQADPVPTEEEPGLLCELFPNIVACAELGEAEEDIPTETRDVTYQAETLFGGGSCPADQTFQFRGTSIPITDYAQACELLATYVRPIALLLAAFTALMIVARGMPE